MAGLLGYVSSTEIVFTEMPDSIPGNFNTYQYDLDSKVLKTIPTGVEEAFTAWDFVSGATVCENTYYAAVDDSLLN